jgi:hypothetical protein
MDCVYLDPGVKADEKRQSLQTMQEALQCTSSVSFWYCLWCDVHLKEKRCSKCGTGIYSFEDCSQRRSLTGKEIVYAIFL